jgi:hypothetical protein
MSCSYLASQTNPPLMGILPRPDNYDPVKWGAPWDKLSEDDQWTAIAFYEDEAKKAGRTGLATTITTGLTDIIKTVTGPKGPIPGGTGTGVKSDGKIFGLEPQHLALIGLGIGGLLILPRIFKR